MGEGPLLEIWPTLPDLGGAAIRRPLDEALEGTGDEPELTVRLVNDAVAAEPEGPQSAAPSASTDAAADQRLTKLMTELVAKLRSQRRIGSSTPALERPCLQPLGEDPNSPRCTRRALDAFYAELREVALGRAESPVRMSVYGDSLVAGDGFPGAVRRLVQRQFGDGGHGFVFIGKPRRPSFAADLGLGQSDKWKVRTFIGANLESSGQKLGFAGAAFNRKRSGGGPTLTLRATSKGLGSGFDRLGLLLHGEVGATGIRLNDGTSDRRLTVPLGPGLDGTHWIDLAEGAKSLRLSEFGAEATWYGAVVERDGPGVVVDNLGLVNARAVNHARIDAAHWARQVRGRDSHLLTYFYGVNAAGERRPGKPWLQGYSEDYGTILRRVRTLTPERDCLVISLLTRGSQGDEGPRTRPSVRPLADAQREAAVAEGCGYWSAFKAAGGKKSAAKWSTHRPRLLGADLAHPTPAGYRVLAKKFYLAFLEGFVDYLTDRMRRQE